MAHCWCVFFLVHLIMLTTSDNNVKEENTPAMRHRQSRRDRTDLLSCSYVAFFNILKYFFLALLFGEARELVTGFSDCFENTSRFAPYL
jgi:hypothetical protein